MVSWCGHEELCINHSSLQLSVSSHTANAHWEWGDVSSSHTSRCRELSPPTAMGTLIICSCWIGKLHYSVPGNVLSIIRTVVWIVRPGTEFFNVDIDIYIILFGEACWHQRNFVKHFSRLGTSPKNVYYIDVEIEESEKWTTSREFSEIETQSSVAKTQRLWSVD